MVEKLLDKGSDPLFKDDDGSVALHIASKSGNMEIIDLLVKANTPIDSTILLYISPFQYEENLIILLLHSLQKWDG